MLKSRYIWGASLLLLLLLTFLLGGCGLMDDNPLANDNTKAVCRDGVEYLVFGKYNSNGDFSISVTAHWKPDGSLYTCSGTTN